MLQESFADRPPDVEGSEHRILGRDRVGEKRLAEWRSTRDQADRPRLDALLMHVDKEETDAFMFRCFWVGAGEKSAPIGILCARCPGFLSIDHPVIACVHGFRLQAREV